MCYPRRVQVFLRRIGFWLFLLSGGRLRVAFDPLSDGLVGLKRIIRRRFPNVSQLSTEELAGWLNDPDRRPPILLDARKPEEYEVSHLPGARNIAPDAPCAEVESKFATVRSIVVYCSVGYRSSAMAQRLMNNGMTNVFNLEGSLFQWANEGRPLVKAGDHSTVDVHPYNERWGVLLGPGLRPVTRRL